jgi:hypothetical protein
MKEKEQTVPVPVNFLNNLDIFLSSDHSNREAGSNFRKDLRFVLFSPEV